MSDFIALQARIKATKSFLNKEMVRLKTSGQATPTVLNQLGTKLDFIHEAERIGVRNLNEHYNRRLNKMIREIEMLENIVLN